MYTYTREHTKVEITVHSYTHMSMYGPAQCTLAHEYTQHTTVHCIAPCTAMSNVQLYMSTHYTQYIAPCTGISYVHLYMSTHYTTVKWTPVQAKCTAQLSVNLYTLHTTVQVCPMYSVQCTPVQVCPIYSIQMYSRVQ